MSILALTLVSLFAGASLVIVTNSLHRVSRSLSASVESVRLSEEAQIGLLVHARLLDSLARARSEAGVRRNLQRAEGFAGTDEESEVLRESRTAVEAYFAATSERPPDSDEVSARLDGAFRAVERLSQINVAESKEARREARRLNRVADLIAVLATVVFIVVVSLVLWWLNTKAFRPSVSLSRAMARFAGGDWEARAPSGGPTELRDMAAHFNDMAEKLAEQRESQAAFLAGVAHDIRTPLGALKMSADLVPADQPLPPEDRIRKTVAVVHRQVDRLGRMVNDLLDTARIEAGELALSTGRHDARELAGSVVNLFAEGSRHRFELDVPDDPVWVECDSGRLEQVLDNLTSNAIKYSPEGGEVRIEVERREGQARIAVTDQGLGISAKDRERIFEPFRRARSTAGEVSGMGLGLFVCRRLVEAHGGSIEISSALGRGSTFSVWLPLASSEE